MSLSRSDIKSLRITDAYSIHRVVYDLFDDVRSEDQKHAGDKSGIVYSDKGGDSNFRNILILSDIPPNAPKYGKMKSKIIPKSMLEYDRYMFEVTMNPSKRNKDLDKVVPIVGREAITKWFLDKSASWGFDVVPESLEVSNISVQRFNKKGHTVTHGSATLSGMLRVTNSDDFIRSVTSGIGRGRAFGFGLLQVSPR